MHSACFTYALLAWVALSFAPATAFDTVPSGTARVPTRPADDNASHPGSTVTVDTSAQGLQRAIAGRQPASPNLSVLATGPLSRTTAYANVPTDLIADVAAGTSTIDVTAYLQQTLDAVEASGGGAVELPRGTFNVCGLAVGANTALVALPFGAVLKATANCGPGPLVSKHAWRDIRRLLHADAAADATSIVVGETAGVEVGHRLLVQSDDGGYTMPVVTGKTDTTIVLSVKVKTAASRGNAWRNLSDPAVTNITLSGLQIHGNATSQTTDYRNILSATQPAAVEPIALDGDLVIGGTAYFTPNSNHFVRVCVTAGEGGKTVTIEGKRSRSNYTRAAVTQTLALPISAGCTQTDIGHQFTSVSKVTVSAKLAGNLYVGAPDGPSSGNCVTFSAPFYRVVDTQMQRCKGWGFRSDWTAGGGGFNSSYAAQQAYMMRVDIDVVGQGIAWVNGPNDSRFSQIHGGFNHNVGFWLDRNSAGSDVSLSHFSGANDGDGFAMPVYQIILDCDTCSSIDTKSEEGSLAQVIVRANNVTVSGGSYFAPYIMAQGKQSRCIQIGDPNYNIDGILAYWIATRAVDCGSIGVYAVPGLDGGWGYIKVLGRDFQTSLAAPAASGATSIKLACGACKDQLFDGATSIIALDSGVQGVTLGAYDSRADTWAVTALTGAASSGKLVYRAYSAAGTFNTTPGQRSDINIYMPYGAYPPSFVQAH